MTHVTRMLVGVVLLGAWIATTTVAGNARGKLETRRSSQGLVTLVTSAEDGNILVTPRGKDGELRAEDFFVDHGHLFGITQPETQLARIRTWQGLAGNTHTAFRQVHEGVRVFGGELRVHQRANGEVYATGGHFFPLPALLGTEPSLDGRAAGAIALELFGRGSATFDRPELVIVDPGWYGDPPRGARLAYYVVVRNPESMASEAFFIDALDGTSLDRWSLDYHALPANRRIYDADSMQPPWPLARADGDPPVYPNPPTNPVNVAFDFVGDAYDLFFRGFGRNGIAGYGAPLEAVVRVPMRSLLNIACPNAVWVSSVQQLWFCQGVNADDITVHEFTHGVIEHTANLMYQNESGMLNESYADIFGELADLYNGNVAWAGAPDESTPWLTAPTYYGPGTDLPNDLRTGCRDTDPSVRWIVAEDVPAWGGGVRDMWDPTCMCDPDRATSPLRTCGEFDNGGVHSGSGIPNHAFALMVDGGSYNGYNIQGLGPIRAAAVWYHALTTYLTQTSNFNDAFNYLALAADDLVGTKPLDPRTGQESGARFSNKNADNVVNALLAVEMDLGEVTCNPGSDCNNNGVEDQCEISAGNLPDCNGNGVPDSCDVSAGASRDCDGDGVPDECAPIDCNGNGVNDACDIEDGTGTDCDGDGALDECGLIDCNANGAHDACDIQSGTGTDCDLNGVLDECEQDCNGNGIGDACEVPLVTRSYLIEIPDLVGLTICPSFDSLANWISTSQSQFEEPWCDGNLTDPGFQWQDDLAPSQVVYDVEVLFDVGTECSSGGAHSTALNGQLDASFTSPYGCVCDGSVLTTVLLDLDPSSYLPGQLNEFRVVDLSACFGLKMTQRPFVTVRSRHEGDCNGDQVPDTCQPDGDQDGLIDACDACINDPQNDIDGDGFCGGVDNCPNHPNPGQEDSDGDGQGDACEAPPGGGGGGCGNNPNGCTTITPKP